MGGGVGALVKQDPVLFRSSLLKLHPGDESNFSEPAWSSG